MLNKLFLSKIIALIILFNFTSESAAQTCTAIPICTHSTDQSYPGISNGMIVWRDCRNGSWDIFGYDLSIDTDNDGVPNWLDPDRPDPDPAEFLVCDLPYSGGWKTDISGKFVVFSYENEGISGIGGYDLNLKREFTVTTSTLGRIAPAICNGKAVWMDYRKGNWAIFGCSLYHDSDDDGTPDIFDPDRPEPNTTGVQLSRVHWWPDPWPTYELPAVSERVSVWEFHRYVMNQINIYGYDLQIDSDEDGVPNWLDHDRPWDYTKGLPDTFAMFCITPNRPGWRGGLAAYGNFFVWEEGLDKAWEWSGSGMDSCLIHGYDLSVDTDGDGTPNYLDPDRPHPDPAEFRITTIPTKRGGGWNNGPAISGNWVVWIDYRNGNADIYGYDLSEDTDEDGIPNYCDADRPNPDPAEKPVITDPSNQWLIRGSAISGSVLTWIDDRNGNSDVYACIVDSDFNPRDPCASIFDRPTNSNLNIPNKAEIGQNYPNPFNSETMFEYNILEATDVAIKIFDLLGREIVTLVDENKMPGSYTVQWNGKDKDDRDLASGVYYYQIAAGEQKQIRKLTMIR